jgi:hypothetical protein
MRTNFVQAAVLATLLPTAACSRQSAATVGADAEVSEPVALRAQQAAFGGRSGWGASSVLVAGTDASARQLAVVVLTRAPDADAEDPWTHFETWLVAVPPEGAAQRLRLISEGAVLGEPPPLPTVTLTADKRVRYVENRRGVVGVMPLMTGTYELTVDPLELVHVSQRRAAWPGGPMSFVGEPEFPGMTCELENGQPCDTSVTLPRVALGDGGQFAAGAWKTTGLGECAMLLDDKHGQPTSPAPATASVRALMTEDALYLEVTDDTFVTRAPVLDRVDITIAPFDWKPGEARILHLTMDGAIISERDSGTERRSSRAEVEIVDPGTRRFRVPPIWGEYASKMARFGYADTDDGRSVRGVLSTGLFTEPIFDLTSSGGHPEVRCTARDGTLRVEGPPREGGAATSFLGWSARP